MSAETLRRAARYFLVSLAAIACAGCATNFEPTPLRADHPASVEAEEAPRPVATRLSRDAITRKTVAQLGREETPTPEYENGPMSHDMSAMGGMDHSKMHGMDMKKSSDETKAETSSATSPGDAPYWTCVMHPEIHQDKPGQCPKCGMGLVKKEGAPSK